MKKVFTPLLTLICSFLLSIPLMAQSPCDTCSAPWGPIQTKTITNQNISTKPDTCYYTFIYEYRERNCSGNIEVDLVSLITRAENANGFCKLNNFSDCYNSRRAGIRSLVDFLGMPITFSQEASCYAMYTVEPPQDYIDCFLSPGEVVDEWHAYIKCDSTSCCRTTYFPNGDGTVNYQTDTTVDCSPGAMPNLPTHLTWECKGQTYIIPVDPNQPINCEVTCTQGAGTLFRKKSNNSIEQNNDSYFTLFPNPTKGNITLEYKIEDVSNLRIRVFNVQGQVIYTKQINSSEHNSPIRIITETWSTGLYTLHFEGNGTLLESRKVQVIK